MDLENCENPSFKMTMTRAQSLVQTEMFFPDLNPSPYLWDELEPDLITHHQWQACKLTLCTSQKLQSALHEEEMKRARKDNV